MYSQNCDVHRHDAHKNNNLYAAIGHSDLYAKTFYCTCIFRLSNNMVLVYNIIKRSCIHSHTSIYYGT